MNASRYEEVVRNLESRGVMPDRPPSLETTRQALQRLATGYGFQIDRNKVIVVAGTNGKGSTCATLEALLIDAGQNVGLYTSPHLIEHTERIRLAGHDVSPGLFVSAFEAVDKNTRDLKLTHFETLTLMAAWLFFSNEITQAVDYAIFEVGLGGLWDATNAIPHSTAVITSLGYDHENLLGRTLIEIARSKLGIIEPNSTIVHEAFSAELTELVEHKRLTFGGQWIESRKVRMRFSEHGFTIDSQWGEAAVNLPGPRGARNTALGLTVFESLGYDAHKHLHALSKVRWPGRMQLVQSNPIPLYLSGDHNASGVMSLIELLPYYPRRHLHLLVGIGHDKNLEEMLIPLFNISHASVYFTETPFKTRRLAGYGCWLKHARGAWPEPIEALIEVQKHAYQQDLIIVTGSLYLVGAIQKKLFQISQV